MASAAPSRPRKTSATKPETWHKNVLCKYCVSGMCSRGQECSYSHDKSLANKKTLPCRFYKAGTCAYGDNCRFSHGQQFPPLNPFAPEYKSKQQQAESTSETEVTKSKKSWADAPEFVPKSMRGQDKKEGSKTWAQVVDPVAAAQDLSVEDAESQLCPFSMVGECRYGAQCNYVHGLICDLCGAPSLHPFHATQRDRHHKICLQQHEADMEHAFAVKRSKDKTCGICMEVVVEKKPSSGARFGIMPSCNHCYCLPCLRKWRQAKQFEHKIVRACPECRVTSDYICPSKYWIDTKAEKDKLLSNYKDELKKKQCKYFMRGRGECPFGNKCFYRHEDSTGNHVELGPPDQQKRRVIRYDFEDDFEADNAVAIQRVILRDFLYSRMDNSSGVPIEEILDMMELFSDDSEYDSDEEW